MSNLRPLFPTLPLYFSLPNIYIIYLFIKEFWKGGQYFWGIQIGKMDQKNVMGGVLNIPKQIIGK